MKIKFKLDKNDLDYYIISLNKQREDCSNLLYYYREHQDVILELRRFIDNKIVKVMKLYRTV